MIFPTFSSKRLLSTCFVLVSQSHLISAAISEAAVRREYYDRLAAEKRAAASLQEDLSPHDPATTNGGRNGVAYATIHAAPMEEELEDDDVDGSSQFIQIRAVEKFSNQKVLSHNDRNRRNSGRGTLSLSRGVNAAASPTLNADSGESSSISDNVLDDLSSLISGEEIGDILAEVRASVFGEKRENGEGIAFDDVFPSTLLDISAAQKNGRNEDSNARFEANPAKASLFNMGPNQDMSELMTEVNRHNTETTSYNDEVGKIVKDFLANHRGTSGVTDEKDHNVVLRQASAIADAWLKP